MITSLEWSATGLGLLYLLLAIREKRSCWLAGGLASALFLFVFWRAGLAAQAVLQIYYVGVAVHGWFYWGSSADSRPVRHLQTSGHVAVVTSCIALSAVTVYFRGDFSSMTIWLDSTTSWSGVIATWLVARKYLSAWTYWIVIDLVTAALYLQNGLLATSGLYLVYAVLAGVAWRQWSKNLSSAQ
ncbi:MAG: nicotinamide riboside transporter PnuC [Pseudomonadota bacterium]